MKFEVSFFGTKSQDSYANLVNPRSRKHTRTMPPASQIFCLTESHSSEKYKIVVCETDKGKKFFQNVREELCRDHPSYDEGRFQMSSFVVNIRNNGWEKLLPRAERSIYVRIVNLTRSEMHLSFNRAKKQPLYKIREGVWLEFPREVVPALGCTEFGARSLGMFSGTSGEVTYNVSGHAGDLMFSWEQPHIGSFACRGQHTSGIFSVQCHVDNLNELKLIYHVYDLSRPPPVQIIQAQAMPLGKSETCNRSNPRKSFHRSIDCTKQIRAAVKSTCGKEWRSSETEDAVLYLPSPSNFYGQCSARDPPFSVTSPHSWLLIEYRIGCEVFTRAWSWDETVTLQALRVGGGVHAGDSQLIFSSVVHPNWQWHPAKLLEGEGILSFRNSGNRSDQLRLKASFRLRESEALKKDELLEAIVSTLQILSDALNPILSKCMHKTFGTNWVERLELAPGHMWRSPSSKENLYDSEGVFTIMVSFWFEAFSDIFKHPTVLQDLHSACIFWATQELSRFDESYVLSVLLSAVHFMKEANLVSAATSINSIINSVYGREAALATNAAEHFTPPNSCSMSPVLAEYVLAESPQSAHRQKQQTGGSKNCAEKASSSSQKQQTGGSKNCAEKASSSSHGRADISETSSVKVSSSMKLRATLQGQPK